MLDVYTLTASETEAATVAEFGACLSVHADKAFAERFEALTNNRALIQKLDNLLARDDNALIVDLIAELSAQFGPADGHMTAASIILSDKLFLEPMFDRIGPATYPVNFASAMFDLDERKNKVSGQGMLRTMGVSAQTLMMLVRGTQTGKLGIAAIRMKDIELAPTQTVSSIAEFEVDTHPRHFRKLNGNGVEKAIKEVCVTNYALALGVMRAARLAAEAHSKDHMLFGKPLGQHQATQMRLSQGVVNEELLRAIAIRQHSEFGALSNMQDAMVRKVRALIQYSITDMAHLHGAESVLGRTWIPFLDLKSLALGLIDDSIA